MRSSLTPGIMGRNVGDPIDPLDGAPKWMQRWLAPPIIWWRGVEDQQVGAIHALLLGGPALFVMILWFFGVNADPNGIGSVASCPAEWKCLGLGWLLNFSGA